MTYFRFTSLRIRVRANQDKRGMTERRLGEVTDAAGQPAKKRKARIAHLIGEFLICRMVGERQQQIEDQVASWHGLAGE